MRANLVGKVVAAGVVLVFIAGCHGPLSLQWTDAEEATAGVLGQRYARAGVSQVKTGNPVLDDLDDFITALDMSLNFPVAETVDLQVFLGNREVSGQAVDSWYGPYSMVVEGWDVGLGIVGHSRPGKTVDPYLFLAGQYLSADVTYLDGYGGVFFDDEDFGVVAGGGVQLQLNRDTSLAPYIKYYDNGLFGEGAKAGGRLDVWLDRTFFWEVIGETKISEDGYEFGTGLGFRF
ncbi:MAG: hypothetical protein CMJ65_01205 [Planctomycetaceae bacterium]|nr:hypothetical protein [Planctomycetaceae bacterium]MDP7276729.1 hypothetical protein [Planctomycetaceae bacterium]